LRYALSQKEPTYIRIGKKGEPVVYEDIPSFQAGKWDQLNDGKDIALLSTGNMLPSTMEVARLLLENNIAATVINASSIRPLDESLLNNLCDNFPLLATIEEHSIVGGLGSAIAEHLIDKNKRSIQLKRFAMPDRFIHETTDQEYARSLCGLLPHQIKDELTKILNQL
jgi:transketolase